MRGDGKPDEDKLKMHATTTSRPSPGAGSGPEQPLAADIQAQIGRRLMAIYDEVLQQPVPDRFRLLLDQLDQKPAPPSDISGSGDGDDI